jgi:glucose/arabinose dehydrogenase
VRAVAAAVVAAAGLALAAATPATAQLRLQGVGTFASPVHVTGAPGDHERLYVVEQRGTVQVVRGGAATQFLDLTGAVRAGGEEGLLSIAFPPDFQQSRLFYAYFTDSTGTNRVEELRAPTGDVADPSYRRLVIELPFTSASNHNGGQLQFGPDGLLYLAPGDGGSSSATAQDLGSPHGKVLRIDPRPSGALGYTIPADNPFVGDPNALDEIWSYGLRNPFRFSFDRLTGDLVIGDVGAGHTEEIDFAPATLGTGRGANFGWNPCEGSFVQGSTTMPCTLPGATAPVIDAFAADGWHAIIAGYVVRDPSVPSLLGRFVYSDNSKGELWSARLTTPQAEDVRSMGISVPGASSFGEDAAGCVYVTQLGGAVSRIVENDVRVPCLPSAAAPVPTLVPQADTPPGLAIGIRRRQRVLRRRGALLSIGCSEPCRVAAGGRLRIGRARYRMRRIVRTAPVLTAPGGNLRRIKVRLTKRGFRALRRCARRGRLRRASVRLDLRATDSAGLRSPVVRRTVRVRR